MYSALDELLLTWATGGQPRGPTYWPPIVAKRRELLERLADWTPPPAVGAVPEVMMDPALIMLWGVTTQRVHEWARNQEGGSELSGTAASPGVVEGLARVVRNVREIGDVREGEILVCSITSPAWAPIFSKIQAAVTDIGGVMSHAAIVCREYGLPAVVGTGRATSQISTGQRIRVDGTAGTRDDPRVSERRPHAAPGRRCAASDSASFGGQELDPRRADRGGDPGPARLRRVDDGVPRVRRGGGARGNDRRRAARMSPDDVDSVGAASHAISEAMRFAPVPDAVRDEVARRYAELAEEAGIDEPPVAVRSSALGEDSQDATFAGQQETYLWVRGADHVCDAVRDCWVSLYSPPAIDVSRPARAGQDEPAMGVAVQLMVDAEVSGVLFTCNPVSGDPSMVAVNASWGLGLAVVGGEVTPDDYLVSKVTGEVVREHVHAKDVEYVPDAGGRGAVRVDVPEERRAVPCLDRPALDALVELGRRIERYFGSHQDVEWAIARGRGLPDEPVRRPVAAGDRAAAARPAAGDAPAMALVMGMFGAGEAESVDADGPERRRRPRDPAAHRRVRARRAPDRDGGPLPPRRARRDRSRVEPEPARPLRARADRDGRGAHEPEDGLTIEAPMIGVFYRAPSPGRAAVRRGRDARRGRHDRLHDRGDEDDELGARRGRGHDRRDPRRERASRSSTVSRSSGWTPDGGAGVRRHRRHDDARRQPEPLGRHRPDRARHPRDRSRRWSASASTRSTSPRARTCRCRSASTARTRGS